MGSEVGDPVALCVDEIIHAIRMGHLLPSHRLGEESFAKKLNVDRSSVRLAFDRLVNSRLLERVHRGGTFVRRIDFREYCETMEVRAVLEGLAGKLACQFASKEDLNSLMTQAEELDQLSHQAQKNFKHFKNLQEVKVREMDFHLKLAKFSNNSVLCRMLTFHHLIHISFVAGIVTPQSQVEN